MEFAIPLCREDLLGSTRKGGYSVKDCLTSRELGGRVDECQLLFAELGPAAIMECFDVFYSVLRHFSAADASVKEHYWNCALEGLVDFCKTLEETDLTAGVSQGNKLEMRNTLKMLTYIVTQFVESFENETVKPAGLEIPTRGRKKKTASAAGRTGVCVWETEREKVVRTLVHLLEQQLPQLCNPPTPEMLDDFTNMVAGCCFKMLENPAVAQDKDTREVIFYLLGLVVKTYNQGVGVSLKAVQLLQHFEHLVGPLSRAVQLIAHEFKAHNFVADIIREVGEKDPSDLATDTSGTRSYAAFIVEVAEAVPALVIPSISHLLPHLSGESHTMRNGVLSVMGAVTAHQMSDPTTISEQQREIRDQLLDKLQSHIHDVNAFVRARSLNVWQQLCNDKAIPLPRLKVVLELAVGRLHDKSSIVRKNAVHLLTTLLTRNPFAAMLNLEEYRSKLEVAKNELRQLLPEGSHEGSHEGSEPHNGSHDGSNGMPNETSGSHEGPSENDGNAANGSEETENANEVAQKLLLVKFLKDAIEFTERMVSCVPVAAQLLGSRMTSDVLEALEFLAVCHQFGLQGSREGLRKALALVWSTEASVKNAVMNVYMRLYLTPDGTTPRQQQVSTIIRNLLSLVSGVTVGEVTSLEELLVLLVKADKISKPVIQMLLDIVAGRVSAITDSSQAMLLLAMAARADREIVSSNIALLIQHGLRKELDLARSCCLALQHLAGAKGTEGSSRLPADHHLFQRLSCLMVEEVGSMDTVLWCPFTEQAVATIFKLAEQPDSVCAGVLRDVCHRVLTSHDDDGDQNYSFLLSRLFFLAGQTAKEQMVHLEVAVLKELKRRRLQQQETEGQQSASSTRSGRRRSLNNKQTPDIEDEMGLDGAAADDMEGELVRKVCEEDVCGCGLLASILPLIVMVLSNPSQYPSVELQSSAVLALANYMLVSSRVCECYLQLMFTLLEKSPTPSIRANVVIALGDMTVRFPNLVEPWTHHLYTRLRDSSSLVRQYTIVVLTHLILNDMIKVHGSVSEMALCLRDDVPSIADRARLFFLELSKKGNVLYNVVPDVVSRLSDPAQSVSEDAFRDIMKYILGFIQKEKQNESLVDKLCHRMRAARSEKQWRDMAFCLSQLSFSEKCLRKLQDNFSCYQDKLTEKDVYSSLSSILQKAKKFSKPEVKVLVEELEAKMVAAHRKGLEEEENVGGRVAEKTGAEEGDGVTTAPEDCAIATEGDQQGSSEQTKAGTSMMTTPAPSKTPRRRGRTTARKRGKKGKTPLSVHNRSVAAVTDQNEEDDFKLSAVSSARRSGSRSRTRHNSDDEKEEEIVRTTRRRKRGKGKGTNEMQPIRRALLATDSDEN